MEYFELNCGVNAGNTGAQDCVENMGAFKKLIVCPVDTEIDTITNAMLEATWQALINAEKGSRIYPLFDHFSITPNQEELVKETGTFGNDEVVREGKDKIDVLFINISDYNHTELRKHNGIGNRGVYIVTERGYIKGMTTDGIKFKPIPISQFFVPSKSISDGSTIARTKCFIEFKDASYMNDKGRWVLPTEFDPLLLEGVKDVRITGTLGSTGGTFSVFGASDTNSFLGLISANWELYATAAPTIKKLVTSVQNLDGTYTLTWSAITGAHTLKLFDQPIGTAGVESINTITGTI